MKVTVYYENGSPRSFATKGFRTMHPAMPTTAGTEIALKMRIGGDLSLGHRF
jgi:hypothetical protein